MQNSCEKQCSGCSDDEVYFGKLSLKKLKKHILWNNHRQSKINMCISPPDCNTSLKIIETHSEPNLQQISVNSAKILSSVPGSPTLVNKKSDEFLTHMENMTENLCLSPGQAEESLELNNTLEVIEYILNNGPKEDKYQSEPLQNDEKETMSCQSSSPSEMSSLPSKISPKNCSTLKQISPETKKTISKSSKYITPVKNKKMLQDKFATSSTSTIEKAKTPTFKTPTNPLSQRKPTASSTVKTPSKTNAYQHITSPIASYINKSPQVPLVKVVYPRKPLPGPSCIPKNIQNCIPSKIHNKENINLPSIAYKNAKKTKVIHVPDEEKLPQSHLVSKMMSSLPQPTVMKHENREIDFLYKPTLNSQEDSFADLPCYQAELSVCTQKTAFKPNKP